MNYKNQKKCPSKENFIKYLEGKSSQEDIVLFEKHLKNCELCKESLQGYKMAFLLDENLNTPKCINSQKRILNPKYFMKWAAVFALLLGLIFVFNNKNKQVQKTTKQETKSTKILLHKTNVNYWYIGEDKKLALNDTFIKSDDFRKALDNNNNKKQIVFQVESTDLEQVELILKKMKLKNNTPIYTFSKRSMF